MNRREFIKTGFTAALSLALPATPLVLEQTGTRHVASAAKVPQPNFGSDLTVAELYQAAGIWYVRLTRPDQVTFWLKSYDGRRWGSLDWQPRRNSRARG
jgi:hypothetical protein